jgi:hypothetical protein
MPQYKVLKSVARNVCASFTGSMNYADTDFVMGHLLTRARASGEREFFIDFVSGAASPVFERPPLARVVPRYRSMFWDNVDKQRSTRAFVSTAKLSISFDTAVKRPNAYDARVEESPYTCTLSLVDDRGIDHGYTSSGWWSPEFPPDVGVFRKLVRRLGAWLGRDRQPPHVTRT